MYFNDTLPRYRVELVRESNPKQWAPVPIRHPSDVHDVLSPFFDTMDREAFVVMMVDTKHRIIGINTVSIGDLSGTLVHPREVFKPAILSNAAAIILAHNHPSGIPSPSAEDMNLTARISAAGELLGIAVLDHVIIGDGTYTSFADKGLLRNRAA